MKNIIGKTVILLTSAILNELRRDGVGYEVQRVFNHVPRTGHLRPDGVLVIPQEGNVIYTCTWAEWRTICSGKQVTVTINDDGSVTIDR